MKKVACPIFDGHEYPKWKAMMKKRLMAMNSEMWTVTEIGLTDLCKTAEADDIRKYTLLNLTAKGVICSCLSQNQFRNAMHLDHAKLIWDRLSVIEPVMILGLRTSRNLSKRCHSNQNHHPLHHALWQKVLR